MAETKEELVPILSRLSPPEGAVKKKRRVGRGVGSGRGKTSGKGMKGQKARHPGDFSKPYFQGGQMPLQRRLPKTGFHNLFRRTLAEVNVRDLARFGAGTTIDEKALRGAGLVRGKCDGIKLLGKGEIDRALTVRVSAFSASAKDKIEKAGGKVEAIAE